MKILEDLGIKTNESGYRFRMVKAMCLCGNVGIYRKNALLSGNTKSCGCRSHRKHIKILSNEPSYAVLNYMKTRCYNKNIDHYKSYGGRGIKVCKLWIENSWAFVDWANKNGYKKGLYIDRIDPNGDYEPDNCRFVNSTLNARNTRVLSTNNKSGYRGVTKHIRNNGGIAWRARIGIKGKNISLGVYDKKELAAISYDNYVIINNTGHSINNITL